MFIQCSEKQCNGKEIENVTVYLMQPISVYMTGFEKTRRPLTIINN